MSSKSTDKETKTVVAEAAGIDKSDTVQAAAGSDKAKKDEAKKTEGTKTEAVKPSDKKAEKVEKEETKAVRKTAAKKTAAKKAERPEVKPEVYIEYHGQQAQQTAVIERVKAAFVASGHRVSSIKSLNIYIKPEEFKAYYVINDGKYTGGVDLF